MVCSPECSISTPPPLLCRPTVGGACADMDRPIVAWADGSLCSAPSHLAVGVGVSSSGLQQIDAVSSAVEDAGPKSSVYGVQYPAACDSAGHLSVLYMPNCFPH